MVLNDYIKEGRGVYMERIDNRQLKVCNSCDKKIPMQIYRVKIYNIKEIDETVEVKHLCKACAVKAFPNYFK